MALIWVKAIRVGFDGMQRRKVDTKFQIVDKKFSEKWMKKIKAPTTHDEDDLVEPDMPTSASTDKGKAKAGGRVSDESKI